MMMLIKGAGFPRINGGGAGITSYQTMDTQIITELYGITAQTTYVVADGIPYVLMTQKKWTYT